MRKWVSILGVLLVLSCNTKVDYSQFKPIKNHQWQSQNAVEFNVDNKDTISQKNVFINIRNNKNYEFSTIFLIAEIAFPSGFQVIDTLEYEMTDAHGNWLGTGYTDVKENKLFYKQEVVFTEKGNYNFQIKQATRSINDIEGSSPLKGITDVGLSIEKVKK